MLVTRLSRLILISDLGLNKDALLALIFRKENETNRSDLRVSSLLPQLRQVSLARYPWLGMLGAVSSARYPRVQTATVEAKQVRLRLPNRNTDSYGSSISL